MREMQYICLFGRSFGPYLVADAEEQLPVGFCGAGRELEFVAVVVDGNGPLNILCEGSLDIPRDVRRGDRAVLDRQVRVVVVLFALLVTVAIGLYTRLLTFFLVRLILDILVGLLAGDVMVLECPLIPSTGIISSFT